MKRKSPTPWLPFSSRLLLLPLPDIFLATWDLAPLSQPTSSPGLFPQKWVGRPTQFLREKPWGRSCFTTSLYKRHFADEDLSIPELSPRNRRNRRKLSPVIFRKYGTALTRWMEIAAHYLCSIRSTIPMISGDFLTRWNAITMRKGREKGQFLFPSCALRALARPNSPFPFPF